MILRVLPEPVFTLSSGRAPGFHVSTIIKDFLLHSNAKRFGGEITDATLARWELGLAWEDLLARTAYSGPGIIAQPKLELDGIHMTPDWFDIPEWRIIESKATHSSANRNILDEWFAHFFWQVMSYCHAADTRRAVLDVLYVNGTYRPMEPIIARYGLKFSKYELAENWDMLRTHRDRMERRDRKKRKA